MVNSESYSNRLARLLKEAGVGKGDRVLLFMSKSPRAVLGMLGTLKVDAMYVPIDTSSPAARVARIVQASEPKVFLTEKNAAHLVDDLFAQGLLAGNVTVGTLRDRTHPEPAFSNQFCLGRHAALQR